MRDCEIHGAACGTETFPESELRDAAAEISPVLNGQILMHAIDIVKHRRRLHSASALAKRLGIPKNSFCRYARGQSCARPGTFNALLTQLAAFDAEARC